MFVNTLEIKLDPDEAFCKLCAQRPKASSIKMKWSESLCKLLELEPNMFISIFEGMEFCRECESEVKAVDYTIRLAASIQDKISKYRLKFSKMLIQRIRNSFEPGTHSLPYRNELLHQLPVLITHNFEPDECVSPDFSSGVLSSPEESIQEPYVDIKIEVVNTSDSETAPLCVSESTIKCGNYAFSALPTTNSTIKVESAIENIITDSAENQLPDSTTSSENEANVTLDALGDVVDQEENLEGNYGKRKFQKLDKTNPKLAPLSNQQPSVCFLNALGLAAIQVTRKSTRNMLRTCNCGLSSCNSKYVSRYVKNNSDTIEHSRNHQAPPSFKKRRVVATRIVPPESVRPNPSVHNTQVVVASNTVKERSILSTLETEADAKLTYKRKNNLKSHTKKDQGELIGISSFQCPFCDRWLSSGVNLDAHILRYHEAQTHPYWCQISQCMKKFQQHATFIHHVEKNHPNFPLEVEDRIGCRRMVTFRDARKAYCHTSKKKMKSLSFRFITCSIKKCRRKFKTQDMLKLHQRERHEQENVAYNCGVCGKKYKVVSALARHEKIHENTTGRQCIYCNGRSFPDTVKLNEHILVTHLDEVGKFSCSICGRVHFDEKSCQRHVKRHENSHECVIRPCKTQSHASQNALRVHVRNRHDRLKLLVCEVCGEEFGGYCANETLKKHMTSHEEILPYKCDYCDRKFKTSFQRKTHQEINHKDKVHNEYSCKVCNKIFCTAIYLYQHNSKYNHGTKSSNKIEHQPPHTRAGRLIRTK